ncbi:MAG TPA: helix-turn-helix transcriptional regulator [Myxococcaceae bacterium]|nr:helix-turn-helix transcriptional regulator [Myxococcaceae bacterium]
MTPPGLALLEPPRPGNPQELSNEITRLALACDCRATFRARALQAIGGLVTFSRGRWHDAASGAPPTEVSLPPSPSVRPHAVAPPGLLCLELERSGKLLAALVLERDDGPFSAEEREVLRSVLPTLTLADEGTAPSSGAPARALSPRESEIVEYIRLGYTNAQIALATGRSVAAVRNLLVRIFDKTGVRTRAQLVDGPLVTQRLTRREREVVQQLRSGFTNREIGHALGISTNTVRNILARLFAKVGVSTRSELMGALAGEDLPSA